MMSYNVTFSKSVAKTILKYDKITRERIYKALYNLPVGDIKRLQGSKNPPYFRLRIGNIRVLFVKDDYKKEIFVFDINTRGDIYR
jgi:mRNA interferase RelE/StbE